MTKKTISIFGSTGSVGTTTLNILRKNKEKFDVKVLTAYKNIDDLAEKTSKFSNDDRLRKKIAKKGHDKYFKYFNSTIIAEFIIQKIFSNNKKRFYWE